ncbi:hypothetical protein FHS42_006617 [Streptomyces zagrosensis]|uniref:Uncharacterized protein n=1 Tax=Streptomyces zagrosensis TaxID=1042984 RepID=A0A7W9QH02_9ACTN|nr:hypothetical protein [Streptomyces zagrosensis]
MKTLPNNSCSQRPAHRLIQKTRRRRTGEFAAVTNA